MPSSHSATVTALAVAVGLQEGFSSSLFATAAIFASVVSAAPVETVLAVGNVGSSDNAFSISRVVPFSGNNLVNLHHSVHLFDHFSSYL
jgi:acid phosphatase family membrane protein YuiD